MSKQYTKPVRAVLLAAGQGKRMKSALPKVLHTVLGKPILARLLDSIDRLGLEHVHTVIGHGADILRKYLQENPPATPWSEHLQEPQLGTGHALAQVAPSLKNFKGTLLVSVADCPLLKAETLEKLITAHQSQGASFSLLTTFVPDAKNYGRILRDSNGRVKAIIEHKDASEAEKQINEINPAIYCIEWPELEAGLAALKNDNKQKEYYLTDLLSWSAQKDLKISDAACQWQEVAGINSQLDLAECSRHLRDETLKNLALEHGVYIEDPQSIWIAPEVKIGSESKILPGCYITGAVEIGAKCVIGPNTEISGPTKIGSGSRISHSVVTNSQIGENCRIGPFAHLRDQAVISEHCRIGNFVEVKKSDIGKKTNVSHLSYIGDSELGESVNIGAGTITANYDRISGRKSKTVIGNNSSTGSNSVLVAPVTIGSDSMVAAATVVSKNVPAGSLAVGRARQENIAGWTEKKREALKQQAGNLPANKV